MPLATKESMPFCVVRVCVCDPINLNGFVVDSCFLNVRVKPGHLFSEIVGLMVVSFRHLDPYLRKRRGWGAEERQTDRQREERESSSTLQCPCFRQITRTAGICRTDCFFKHSPPQNSNWLLVTHIYSRFKFSSNSSSFLSHNGQFCCGHGGLVK